jgi:uncharacterized membrane protein YgdD (TMEM256/DUF423 family)
MIRIWLAAASVVGFMSVVAGAIGAHIATGGRSVELLRTGALFGIAHAATLVAIVAMIEARDAPAPALIVAGWTFTCGILLFSLSLFALALTGIEPLGVATPFGGLGLLIGWAAFGVHALRRL